MTLTYNELSWSVIKSQIFSKSNPCYLSYDDVSGSSSHAVVLVGYDYESDNDSNYRMYLMDPNLTNNYAIISYGSYYVTSYGYTFVWDASLYES